jgi:hypothetical protein
LGLIYPVFLCISLFAGPFGRSSFLNFGQWLLAHLFLAIFVFAEVVIFTHQELLLLLLCHLVPLFAAEHLVFATLALEIVLAVDFFACLIGPVEHFKRREHLKDLCTVVCFLGEVIGHQIDIFQVAQTFLENIACVN